MDRVLRIAIETLGVDAVKAALAEFEKPVVETKKVAVKTKEEKTTEKRISRMSPTLSNQLKTELKTAGFVMADEKKDFDKIKKEFTAFVEELTEDDFTSKSLSDHMKEFARIKTPGGRAAAGEAVEPPKAKKEPKKKTNDGPPESAEIVKLSLADLQKVNKIATPTKGKTGVYWDGDTARWITGPTQDDDEDMTPITYKGKKYVVGDKTGRIYEETDNADVFVGFIGVGPYHEMKL